jgi:hypothetical protein
MAPESYDANWFFKLLQHKTQYINLNRLMSLYSHDSVLPNNLPCVGRIQHRYAAA